MQLIDKQTKMLFPTPMFSGKVSDLGVCDRVEKKLREMQKSGQGLKHNFEDFAFLTADDIQNSSGDERVGRYDHE